ncbi:MAG: PGPGW domain-containing protein [Candidatus Hydrogenedentota bacterium]
MIIRYARRLVIAVIGVTVVLFGVLLLFIPGPGTVVIAAGVAVLATEFIWARVLLKRMKHETMRAGRAVGIFTPAPTDRPPDPDG